MRRSQSPAVRTWHVFARGARRLALFYEEGDYRQFLLYIQEALILSGCVLFGYALMGNHYHLMLQGSQAQISDCMQRLNWRYALYHNDRHRMGGHVFDGPYKDYPQRSLKWLLWRLAYVFLNPVKAGLSADPASYPWSGYLSFLGQPGSPLAVSPLPELPMMGWPVDVARASFLSMLKDQAEHGEARGSATPTAREIQLDQFQWVRREAERRVLLVPEIDAESLALWWGREMGVPPAVMVKALELRDRHEVRRIIQRLDERVHCDELLARQLAL